MSGQRVGEVEVEVLAGLSTHSRGEVGEQPEGSILLPQGRVRGRLFQQHVVKLPLSRELQTPVQLTLLFWEGSGKRKIVHRPRR